MVEENEGLQRLSVGNDRHWDHDGLAYALRDEAAPICHLSFTHTPRLLCDSSAHVTGQEV
jgi:hypothetical protein